MNSLFWERAHGGLTHLPIALIFAAALFDALGFFRRRSSKQGEFKAIGYWLVLFGALGSFGAAFSGLMLSKGTISGTGTILRHHYFVWPSFTLIVGLATWRFLVGRNPSRRAFTLYLATMLLACSLMGAAGFFGGEMLLGH
jgi:uncharacterized membrane protein